MKFRDVKECKGIYGLSRMVLINHEKKGPIKPLTEKKSESNFITVECLLAFDKDEDKGRVLALMRKFSSMVRFAYKRLLDGAERKELKKLLSRKYGINTRYPADAILLRWNKKAGKFSP